MRRIAHLSDLHFGALDPQTVEPLLAALDGIRPDVFAISGDLTQRARRGQFEEARRFLSRLPPRPRIVVPGNHDIPLWDVGRRFLRARKRFDRYVTRERFPSHVDSELAIVGVDTARSLTIKNGRINERQLHVLREAFSEVPRTALKVIVAHHPFVVPEEGNLVPVGRAALALDELTPVGVHVLLTGHGHHSWIGRRGHTLMVHAGTTTSRRSRGEANSFNIVDVNREDVVVQRYTFDGDAQRFAPDGAPHKSTRPL